MSPTRVILLGGFLGAGKTTLIAQLLKHFTRQHKRAAVVTNDQAANLVDTALLASISPEIGEVAGACFCCSFDNFISELKRLGDTFAPDLLIGEPVGSCTDLAATVVNPLKKFYADLFRTAPYSVLVDPARYKDAFAPAADRPFPDDIAYIYRLQIEEADAILLNKTDLLSPAELAALKADIAARYPARPIFPISAATGQGLDDWINFVLPDPQAEGLQSLGHSPAPAHPIQVDYDRYAAGEAALAWLNASVELAAAADTDWSAFARTLLETLREHLILHHAPLAHAKLFLTAPPPAAGTLSANLTGNSAPVSLRGQIPRTARSVNLLINLRAQTSPQTLHQITTAALEKRSQESFPASLHITITEIQSFSPARPNPTHRLNTPES